MMRRALPSGRKRRLLLIALAAACLLLLAAAPAALGDALTPESGGSSNANDIDTLYKITLYVAIVIFLIVEGTLIWSLVRHRARRGAPEGAQIRGNTPRELAEEVGLLDFELGPLIWTRHHWHVDPTRWGGQDERVYLVRTEAFDLAPSFSEDQLAEEGVHEARWFSLDELATLVTGPSRLAELVRDVLR